MRLLALSAVGALGGALALNAVETTLSQEAQAQNESAANVIAVQIRKQGFACEKAQSAEKDAKADRPDSPVWILDCGNASYRVRLVPNMAAKVEKLD
ncbi:MAG TPA: hypothetical protein VGA65_05390 [Hyphomicrobium sp.]|jgi:hypothetical protein